jgi:hypothetical protein
MIISTRDYSMLTVEDFDALLAENDNITIANNHSDYKDGYVVGGAHGFSEVWLPNTPDGRYTAAAEVADRLILGHDVGIWTEDGAWLEDGEILIDSIDVHTSQGDAMLCACSRGERAYYHIDTN